ncbi:MAG: Heat-inducible transcription repressor HrcA [Acidimicrobiales bacterium AG-410-I20]|nr:MAG: Heat-inducible transcription repressor HrcA [Acidimicrobiales bacterium AG-410-I20]
MLEERKAAILSAVVEEYIETETPVGSTHIAKAPGVKVSSATVRNELVQLEEQGYLFQPHTSAGRIPTDKAYRFFVDQIETPDSLSPVEGSKVSEFFARSYNELEEMLRDTSTLLASLTGSASVVVAPDRDHHEIRSVQLVGLGSQVAMLVLVTANGEVEKHVIELVSEMPESTLAIANAHLAASLIGSKSSDSFSPPASGDSEVDEVISSALLSLSDRTEILKRAYVGGTSQVAAAFEEVERVQQVLSVLERQFVVVSLMRDVIDRGLSVAIGSETGVAPLSECSLVVAPYEVEGESSGSIAVLGPTRMNYSRALATVAVVGRQLGNRLTKG